MTLRSNDLPLCKTFSEYQNFIEETFYFLFPLRNISFFAQFKLLEYGSQIKLPKRVANADDLCRAPPESWARSRLFRALCIFFHSFLIYTSTFLAASSSYCSAPRYCVPLKAGMHFANKSAHARVLCVHITQISEELVVMKKDIPNISGSGATGIISATTGKFDEAASLRTDGHSANHSRAETGLRDELTRLKSDLDALMSHASTLTDMELREARDRILIRFASIRYMVYGMLAQAGKQLSHGKNITLDYVRSKPLQCVAIAAGAGLLLGMLIRRD